MALKSLMSSQVKILRCKDFDDLVENAVVDQDRAQQRFF